MGKTITMSVPYSWCFALQCRLRVKTGKALGEHIFSALPPIADIAQRCWHVRKAANSRHPPKRWSRLVAPKRKGGATTSTKFSLSVEVYSDLTPGV